MSNLSSLLENRALIFKAEAWNTVGNVLDVTGS